MAAPVTIWTLEHIRQHIAEGLPLVPLFNIDVIEASAERGVVRLREGEQSPVQAAASPGRSSSRWPMWRSMR